MKDLEGKVCIVTGANTGIGKETARGLAARGARVVIAARNSDKARAARDDVAGTTGSALVDTLPLDLASVDSIRELARVFSDRYDRLDVLVNNAGVFTRTRSTTKDGFETTFGVNHLGTFLLTHELRPMLEKSAPSRVVVVSSDLHYRGTMQWDDLMCERHSYGGTRAYNQSKLANVLFTKALARRLTDRGVTVNALHPGVVATELTRELPGLVRAIANLVLLTPAKGAATSLHVATSVECGTSTGLYFAKSRPKKASREARDEEAQERLWTLSEKLLGTRAGAAAAARRSAAAGA